MLEMSISSSARCAISPVRGSPPRTIPSTPAWHEGAEQSTPHQAGRIPMNDDLSGERGESVLPLTMPLVSDLGLASPPAGKRASQGMPDVVLHLHNDHRRQSREAADRTAQHTIRRA